MQEQPGKIYKAISEIMSEVGHIGKDQTNRQQGFKYRGIDDIYNHLNKIMSRHGVFTTSHIMNIESTERRTKNGSTMYVEKIKITYTFFTEDGSSVESTIVGTAMDTGDKAGNKAQAIAHKYALLQIFCIPTDEIKDPDAETPPETLPQQKVDTTRPTPDLALKVKKPLTRAQKFAITVEKYAKDSGLPLKQYSNARHYFLSEVLGRVVSKSTELNDKDMDAVAEVVKNVPEAIPNSIRAFMKGLQ